MKTYKVYEDIQNEILKICQVYVHLGILNAHITDGIKVKDFHVQNKVSDLMFKNFHNCNIHNLMHYKRKKEMCTRLDQD